MKMKKASVRFLSAVLAFLLLCTVAACAPSTDDASPSTEAYIPTVPKAPTTPKAPTEGETEDSGGGDVLSGVLFEEDFEDLDGWEELPAKGVPEGATAGIVDGKLNIDVPTTVKALVGKTHELDFSGQITFEVDITATFPEGAVTSKAGGAVIVYTDDNQPALTFYLFNGKYGYYNVDRTPNAGVTQIPGYVSGSTCHLKMVADTDMETYDIFVNGAVLMRDVQFRSSGSVFTMIQLGSGGQDVGANVTFDNLKISVTDESDDDSTGDSTNTPSGGNTTMALPFEEDFADLNGWDELPEKGIPDGATAGIVDGKLSVNVPTTMKTLVAKTHALNCSGQITFEVDMTATFPEGSVASKAGGAVIIYTDDNEPAICFYLFNGKYGYYNVDRTPSAGVTQIPGYVNGSTCHLKLVADTDTETYDIYVNGAVLMRDVQFRSSGANFTMIQLGSGGQDVGATATFDNLKIRVTDESDKDSKDDPADKPSGGSTTTALPFEEDFKDLNGWEELPAKGVPEGATAGIVDGKLSVFVPTTMKTLVAKTHELNCSGKVTFEVDMTVTFPAGAVASKAGGAVIVYTDDNQPALCFYIFNGKYGYYNVDRTPSAGVTQIPGYVSGAACHLKIVADTDTETYDIYVNDTVLMRDVKFRSSGENFTMIQLGSGGHDVGATATFDNLKIYATEE